jgi:hypothetical protein
LFRFNNDQRKIVKISTRNQKKMIHVRIGHENIRFGK